LKDPALRKKRATEIRSCTGLFEVKKEKKSPLGRGVKKKGGKVRGMREEGNNGAGLKAEKNERRIGEEKKERKGPNRPIAGKKQEKRSITKTRVVLRNSKEGKNEDPKRGRNKQAKETTGPTAARLKKRGTKKSFSYRGKNEEHRPRPQGRRDLWKREASPGTGKSSLES